ncbi:MAG TPA: PEGA domain-containing protein, partial [Candidatus Saccharimonadia bacterium]
MPRKFIGIISYIFATVIVIGGTVLLVAYGNGYTYNFTSGKLVQRGLLLLSSVPNGATITLGGKQLDQKSPYRNSFEQGWYDFTLGRDGYRTWHKSIQVKPSLVSLHQYVILLRQRPLTDSIATHGSISQMVGSPDNRRVGFVVPHGDQAGLWSLDGENFEQTRLLPLPVTADPVAPEVLSILSWSNDASHLLVRRVKGAENSLLVVSNNTSEAPLSIAGIFNITP